MMIRRHIRRFAAAAPRTPHTFLRNSGRSDRSETMALGPKGRNRGLGKNILKQCLVAQLRPERPERPEIQPLHARARNRGFGGNKTFHALLGISGRSGRSGPDPPSLCFVISGLGVLWFRYFQTLLNSFQTH